MISFIILNENYSKSAVIVKFFAENEGRALVFRIISMKIERNVPKTL